MNYEFLLWYAMSVFFISEQMVIGPTPPGTGVMKEHFGATFSKSTSPERRKPLLRVASGTRVVPTSMMTAPSFTISAVTNPGLPMAAMMISSFVMWNPKTQQLRALTVPTSLMWLIYNIINNSYSGTATEIFNLLSIAIGLFRFRKKDNA